jgi:hypothetical protein
MKRAGHVARMGDRNILVAKREGNALLGRHKQGWKDNINMILKGIKCQGVDRIHLALNKDQWRALVNSLMQCFPTGVTGTRGGPQ